MKKIIFFFLFWAVCTAVNSQSSLIPYSIRFRGAYGEPINAGKSYLYVSPETNRVRSDGVLPPTEDHPDYSGYEWYFVPVENESGWYYLKNGAGQYLLNRNSAISVGEWIPDETAKWRLFKINTVSQVEPENSFRLVQHVGGRSCHIVRSTNTFITISRTFTSGQNTLLIQPSRSSLLYNPDMELVTNYESQKLTSAISLDPPFLAEETIVPDAVVNDYYFPANFRRTGTAMASLAYDYKSGIDSPDAYFIRLRKNAGVRTPLFHQGEKSVFYKISMDVRSSQVTESPATIRLMDASQAKQVEKPLSIREADRWEKYETYIQLTDYMPGVSIDIDASLIDDYAYVDIDRLVVEKVEGLPVSGVPFLPGEYNENGEALYDYPYGDPAFTYTVRISASELKDTESVFLPFHFFEEVANLKVCTDKVNGLEVESGTIENVRMDEKGIYLSEPELFHAGNDYSLLVAAEWEENLYTLPVRVKIVPEKVFWNPFPGIYANAWNRDENWKDINGNPAFVPLKTTQVVLSENQLSYPLLNKEESGDYFDYNYRPNVCDTLFFRNGSELGNPFYLDYEQTEIEWGIRTMQWYNVSAPLKNMYSGDFLFDRLNPLSEFRMHRTENPQTGFYTSDWTQSFPNTNIPLVPGKGYSLRVGSVYYKQMNESGADESSKVSIDKAAYRFPNNQSSFRFYDEITKLPSDKIEYLPVDGRKLAHRFIYEIPEGEECRVPQGEQLLEVDTQVDTGEASVVVGNPFMSHFAFQFFYFHNRDLIYPEYKLLNEDGEYITVHGTDENEDGMIDSYLFSGNYPIDLFAIKPMQSFIVTTKETYSGQPLVIGKSMSGIKAHVLEELSKKQSVLSIGLVNDSQERTEVFLYDKPVGEKMNSRKMVAKDVDDCSYLFVVSDDAFFDIHTIGDSIDDVRLGMIIPEGTSNELVIQNISSLRDKDYYLYDAETQVKIPLADQDSISYVFSAGSRDVTDRFYIKRNTLSSVVPEPTNGNIEVTWSDDRLLIVTHPQDLIEEVTIYTADGYRMVRLTDVHSSRLTVPEKLTAHTIYLVHVKTQSDFKIFKTFN